MDAFGYSTAPAFFCLRPGMARSAMAILLLPRTKQPTVQPMKTTAVELFRPCELTHEPAFARAPVKGRRNCSKADSRSAASRPSQRRVPGDARARDAESLAPIRNAVEIFRLKGAADPELQEVTAMVERQIQQLTRLVDDLLDVFASATARSISS